MIDGDYLDKAVEFLHSVKWIFNVPNTEYVKEEVLLENAAFLASLDGFNPNSLIIPKKKLSALKDHPENLQFIKNINDFRLTFEIADCGEIRPTKKVGVKKKYEIENVAKVCSSQVLLSISKLIYAHVVF